jgi:hypothetical protein
VYDLFLSLNMNRICNLLDVGPDKRFFFLTTRINLSKEEASISTARVQGYEPDHS